MPVDPFDTAAAWYDLLAGGPARVERESGLLRHALGPGRRVLDLACGTGLHARLFAELGASVVAVDLSRTMLQSARALRDHPRVQWVQGSMLTPPVFAMDLAVCQGNSIALMETPADIERFFGEAAGALVIGGALLVQLLNGRGSVWRTTRTREVFTRLNGAPVTIRKRWTFLEATETALHLELAVERVSTSSAISVEQVKTVLRLWYPDVLEARAGAAGLTLEARWGGMAREPYEADSSADYVALWRRPER